MSQFDIRRVAEGLTAYAIERQHGWERHQPDGTPPWSEQRRFWTDAIFQGMARLNGLEPDPALMEHFDRELEQARSCYFFVPATRQAQRDTILELRRFVSALEATGDDRRRQVDVVWKLFEDMSSHLPWAGKDSGLDFARDEAERALVRMTAQMPIRFTRVLLGGDAGPHWASGFVSGAVTGAEAVKQTTVYQDAVRNYPEIKNWPALCTVYVGRGLPAALGSVDASEFDLEIMNRVGDKFLDQRGIRWLGGPYQMTIPSPAEIVEAETSEDWKSIQYPLLHGSRSLTAADLDVQEKIGAEDGRIDFCLDVLADEETVFGRQLSSEEEESYIQSYTSYLEDAGQVDDTLDVVVRSPGGDEWFSCALTEETRESLKWKMDAFCVEMYGEHLPEPSELQQDESSSIQIGPAM